MGAAGAAVKTGAREDRDNRSSGGRRAGEAPDLPGWRIGAASIILGGMSPRAVRIAAFAAISAAAVAIFLAAQHWRAGGGGAGFARIGGPFTLIDQDGRTRTDADFRGRHMLVYFGYTYCPDVCPTALSDMAIALDEIGADATKVRPVFVTVDPARDTPARLKDYVANFHPRLVGLTGSDDAIARAAKAYRVYYAKARDSGSAADYLMDHSSIIYLIGPDGRYVAHFSHGAPAERIVAALRDALS